MNNIILYLKESYYEFVEKVSWPTKENLVDSAKVVIFSSLFLALVVFVMDFAVNQILDFIYSF